MLREEIQSLKATRPELRKFGLTIGIFLLAIASFLWGKQRPSFPYFAYAGGGIILLGLAAPILLKPIYKAWMAFAVVMGFVMTRVILTIIFFGLFTPISLIAKLFGKDLLDERWDSDATTYWIKRPMTNFDPKSAENMF
ncbi:MAG: hypothetical protein ALAOOOJD_03014 [bacterium]|nr:hypothetical protein [bacterium]